VKKFFLLILLILAFGEMLDDDKQCGSMNMPGGKPSGIDTASLGLVPNRWADPVKGNGIKPKMKNTQKQIEFYQCAECGLHYRDKETAKQCEEWCKEHNSCNLEITRHSVERSPKNNSSTQGGN
jgi:hypothetical protein